MKNISKILIVTLIIIVTIFACNKNEDSKIISIEIKTLPEKVNYIEGDTFDFSGLTVTLNMEDGSKKDVDYGNFRNEQIVFTEGELVNSSIEMRVIHLDSEVSTFFRINIIEKSVAILSVKNLPYKTEYIEGEKLDLTGLVITLTYNNENTEDVELLDFEDRGIEISVELATVLISGLKSIEIRDSYAQVATNLDITVKKVLGIALVNAPHKYEYYVGEILDFSDLEIVLIMDNSQSSSAIKLENFNDFSISLLPEHNKVIDSVFEQLNITHTISGKSIAIAPYIVHEYLTDIDGNNYNIVRIEDDVWMAENLKVTRYTDGTEIPLIEQDDIWGGSWDAPFKGFCYYNDNANGEKDIYGALYTYAAAVNGTPYVDEAIQGACPSGWHVPSDSEWSSIGGGYQTGAIRLKEAGSEHWGESNNGNDYFGFKALPGGWRGSNETYNFGTSAYFWSSNEINNHYAGGFSMSNSNDYFMSGTHFKNTGYSIRCVKDRD